MFRFSIRELMLVTLVVVLAVAWVFDRARLGTLAWQVESLKAKVESTGRIVKINGRSIGYEFDGKTPPSYPAGQP